jgi:hypothetical protein
LSPRIPETQPSDDFVDDAKLELGKWAENRLKEAQRFARLVRAGKPPESLRTEFSVLFTDVIDRLTKPGRESLFENAQRLLMKIPDLMEYIADVKGMKGPTLGDYRSDFRRSMKNAPRVGRGLASRKATLLKQLWAFFPRVRCC